jgi:hypothetical protein
LVFIDPPEASSTCPPVVEHIPNIEQFVNTSQFAIDDTHPINSQMIGYKEWLFESYQVAKNGSKHSDVDICLHSKAAHKALWNELVIITEQTKRKTKKVVSNDVIECGESCLIISRLSHFQSSTTSILHLRGSQYPSCAIYCCLWFTFCVGFLWLTAIYLLLVCGW